MAGMLLFLAGGLTATAAPNAAPALEADARMGINLAAVADWGTELPFVDVFKTARRWISQQDGQPFGQGPELELDARGNVKSLEPGAYAQTTVFTDNREGRYPAGVYVLLYEGTGTIGIEKGPQEVSRQPGRIEYDVDPARDRGMWITLRETDPNDPVRNIRFIMPGFEETYAEQIFHPDFLKRWGNMASIRFMDWMRTNNSPLVEWKDRPLPADATWTTKGGVPLEIMIKLSNQWKIAPWFCMPHQADDTFVREFATMVRDQLDPALPIYVEYSNEVWNNLFEQHQYASKQGLALGFGQPEKPWSAAWSYTARRSLEIFRIWEEVFGGTERFTRVLASQGANSFVAARILEFEDAGHEADALAIAPYMSFNIAETSTRGHPPAAEVAAWEPAQVVEYMRVSSLPSAVERMTQNRAVAEQYGLKLIAYEAGQHAVGVRAATSDERLTAVLTAANRLPAMGELYTDYMNAWQDNGGDLMCLFSSVVAWSQWGSWGLMEYYDQTDEEMPKMGAVSAWMEAHQK